VADAELIAGMLLLMLAIHLSERRAEQARRAAVQTDADSGLAN
jgi:hypothetical protein